MWGSLACRALRLVLLSLVAVFQLKRIKPPEKAIRSTRRTLAAVRGRKGD